MMAQDGRIVADHLELRGAQLLGREAEDADAPRSLAEQLRPVSVSRRRDCSGSANASAMNGNPPSAATAAAKPARR